MSVRFLASIAIVMMLAGPLAATNEDLDAGEIVERLVAEEEANYEWARRYQYEQETTTEKLDKHQKVVKSDTKTSKQRLQRQISYKVQGVKGGKEVQTEVGFGTAADETQSEKDGTYLEAMTIGELSRYYDFTRVKDENVGGLKHYVLEFKPKEGKDIPKAKSREEKVLAHLAGKLWIHPTDFSIVMSDSKLVSPLPFAIIDLVSLRDLRIHYEAQKLDDKAWLPKQMEVSYQVRILYFKMIRERQKVTMRNFQKAEAAKL
jgi:hypothetical protein